jgi:hypothetical protein
LSVFKPIVRRLAETVWMQNALKEDGDLHVFRQRPPAQVYLGIGLILISYIIGWPAVVLLGLIAFYTGKPLVLAIGGPLTYGLSHLVFLAGLYLAGKRYAAALARRVAKKLLAGSPE